VGEADGRQSSHSTVHAKNAKIAEILQEVKDHPEFELKM